MQIASTYNMYCILFTTTPNMYYGAYLLTFLLIITVHKDKKLSKSLYRSLYTCLIFLNYLLI